MFRDRMTYLTEARSGTESDCFLCEAGASESDDEHMILARRADAFALMNKYPYNTGHAMVSPHRHTGKLEDLDAAVVAQLMDLVAECMRALNETMSPEGFNLGANLGAAAGAGVPAHLHLHVVPRWSSDTNFMPVTADTKVLPESLQNSFNRLKPAFG